MARARTDRYARLAAYLAAQRAETTTVTLTFAELERLIGGLLPPSAWSPGWWAKRRRDALWRTAGWRPGAPRRVDGRLAVTFERVADSTPEPGAPGRPPAPEAGPERRRGDS